MAYLAKIDHRGPAPRWCRNIRIILKTIYQSEKIMKGYLGGLDNDRRRPGDIHGPLSMTVQPPPHPRPANAAAGATTGCNVAGPSISTPTAGRRTHNHQPTAPQRATHNITTGTTTHQKRPCRRRQRHDRPNGKPADHAAAGAARHQPCCYRTNTPTANRPHADRP